MILMANYDEAQKPLLIRGSNKEDSIKSNEENKSLSRIRFRRVKTTPSTHSNPLHFTPPHDLSSYNNKPAFLHVFLVLSLYLGVGTICFVLVRAQLDGKKTTDVVDALYFCIVTMTTVGYGDLVPATTLAKLLSCFFVFTGMAIVGMILSQAADYFVEKHEALMAKALLLRHKATPAQILKEVETNKTKYKLLMALLFLILLITFGTFFLTLHEHMRLIDAFYCVCATITTLGYGDASFVTRGGRIFAVFWILSSTLCLAQFFFYLTEFYTESRRRSILKRVLSRKLTLADIEAADLDNDHVVRVHSTQAKRDGEDKC
ncbi:two-pore potassium channel 1-like isoform X2 [Silene latifolia]|uniref:two-pore potassium channel 1-like isoform X2 n=1 Tax=Silene latifolia TaxID=37657 RepID=UPI003D77DF2D